eukprot:1232875-Lingulodinium_polyedra.AAC.1
MCIRDSLATVREDPVHNVSHVQASLAHILKPPSHPKDTAKAALDMMGYLCLAWRMTPQKYCPQWLKGVRVV